MIDRAQAFELVVRRFLGKKRAYHIASTECDHKERKKWLVKVAKRIVREVDEIDTLEEHRAQLHLFANEYKESLKGANPEQQYTIYALLGLVASLLGRISANGSRLCSPNYTLSVHEYYTHLIRRGGEPLQYHYDKYNVVNERRNVATFLKERGLTNSQVALVMNISEYQLKQLRT